jgi:hypothetical protein
MEWNLYFIEISSKMIERCQSFFCLLLECYIVELTAGKPRPGELVRRRRIIRASFSQQGMNYHRETGQVEYRSKDGKETKVFEALEWPR